MKTVTRISLLVLLGFLALSSRLAAGEIWEETTYYAEDFKPDLKVPIPGPAWKIYSKKMISYGDKAQGVEELDGQDRGTVFWLVGKTVVSIQKSGEVSVYPRNLGEASLWDSPSSDVAWTKNLDPIKKMKQNGQDIFLYEQGGGFKRLWILADTLLPVAQVEGKFVTLFVKLKGPVDVNPPAAVTKALEENRRAERKLSEFGSMPQ